MFTPFKLKSSRNYSVLNDTVLNTPQPQATSTVRRKSTYTYGKISKISCFRLKYQFEDKLHSGEEKRKQDSPEKELTPKEDNTLLGILDNMSDISIAEDEQKLNCSSFDEDLKSAKRLLQKCSDIKNSSLTIDTNKENNANMQNMVGTVPVSNFTFPFEAYTSELDKECMNHSTSEVTFEPNEITAQSSVISSSAKRQSPVNKSFKSTSFNDNNVYEMMAEINNNENFLSGSKMVQQLSIDEAFWKQSCTHCFSLNPEKEKVHCSSLSGFIEDIDLSIESCAGRKVSVGQYFERKSSEMEMLGNNEKVNFDAVSETPVRGKSPALVESTILTDATVSSSELEEKENTLIPASRDTDENSIISLSTIAKILQDANSETPRRLVDQLLMAQKKKEKNSKIRDARKEATMPSNEKSTLTMPIGIFNNFDGNIHKTNSSTNVSKKKILKEGACNENMLSPFVQDLGVSSSDFTFSLQNSVLSCSDKWTALSNVSLKMNRKSYDEESYNDLNIQSKEVIKERDISNSVISSSFSVKTNAEIQFESNKNIVFGENTEKLCNCIVGMTSEVNVELVNNGDRWITCIFKPTEIVGDTQSIELNISSESLLNNFLIKPNASQSTKIEVKVTKMCKPIFVVLNVFLLDMVTNSKWSMEHIIFVHPEQLELDIICPFDKQELDFQCIAEERTKVLPITFYNKNNVDVPVKLSILQDESKMFSINVPAHLVLKSHEKCIINVKCKKSRSTSIDSPRRQPQHWKSKLIVRVQYKDDTMLLRKEVPLYAQIGVCKIQMIDTEIPIVVSRQQGKLINIVNSGNVATQVSASIVPIEGHPNTQDFSIKPDNVFLQVGEQNSFLIVYKPQFSHANSVDNERYARIKLIAENNVYHYVISTKQSLLYIESEKENYFRCHTPNNIVSTSPAISPQSVTSDRSGPCDRNSPISMVSIAVAGDTFPIKSTHPVLVWGSVKTGKSETKKFTICNISNNKIKIQIDIHDVNKNFKFIGDKQTVNTSMILAMQRQEFKTLTVAFSPYCVGAVVGKITIKHYAKENNDSQQSKKIRLYGYGGFSKVKIGGTFKDANGKMWYSLGNLYSETTTLSANITLDNVGDLCSFAKITVVPKVIFSTINSSWYINLKEVILNPKESQQITIQFHPKKEEFALLQRSEVSHVATINVTYGDEPTRWRIRRLYNKIKESGELTKNKNEILKNIVQPIYNAFPGEHFTPDLMSIHDSIQNLRDVCTGVHQSEIMLTVEACADDILPVHYDTDESKMYQTLSDTTYVDEANGASFFASQ